MQRHTYLRDALAKGSQVFFFCHCCRLLIFSTFPRFTKSLCNRRVQKDFQTDRQTCRQSQRQADKSVPHEPQTSSPFFSFTFSSLHYLLLKAGSRQKAGKKGFISEQRQQQQHLQIESCRQRAQTSEWSKKRRRERVMTDRQTNYRESKGRRRGRKKRKGGGVANLCKIEESCNLQQLWSGHNRSHCRKFSAYAMPHLHICKLTTTTQVKGQSVRLLFPFMFSPFLLFSLSCFSLEAKGQR